MPLHTLEAIDVASTFEGISSIDLLGRAILVMGMHRKTTTAGGLWLGLVDGKLSPLSPIVEPVDARVPLTDVNKPVLPRARDALINLTDPRNSNDLVSYWPTAIGFYSLVREAQVLNPDHLWEVTPMGEDVVVRPAVLRFRSP